MATRPQRGAPPRGLKGALLGVLAVAVVGGGLAMAVAGWFAHSNKRSVQQLAAPHLGCPPQSIDVKEEELDIEESYRVEGCGKRGRVRCAPQDPTCGFFPE